MNLHVEHAVGSRFFVGGRSAAVQHVVEHASWAAMKLRTDILAHTVFGVGTHSMMPQSHVSRITMNLHFGHALGN